MTDGWRPLGAPRSQPRIGAFLCSLVVAVSLIPSVGLSGQEPPDSLVAPDSLAAVRDSTVVDSLALDVLPDSVSPDTIFYNLPAFEGEVPDGWGTGVWSWNQGAIMAAGANTLAELVAEIPGLIVLAAGDYGTPSAISAFGSGGGGLRVFRDGFELPPLEGGVVDLARVGLVGIGRVRLERGMGQLRLELWSIEYDDGRSYSLVEAGTGDLGTNIFRGTYTDPTGLGGSVGVGLERVDTQGPGRRESGNRTGNWMRYQLHRGDDAGLALDFRRMGTESDLADFASPVTRTDWSLRGRMRLAEGLVSEAYIGKSSHEVEDVRDAYALEGGSRSQQGLRLGLNRPGLWARGEYRRFGGDGLPSDRIDLTGGVSRTGVGGVSVDLARGSWTDNSTSSRRARAWTEPFLAIVSLFGSWESGTYGSRTMPLLEAAFTSDSTVEERVNSSEAEDDAPSVPLFGITDRRATRVGAALLWRGFSLSGAVLEIESDSLIPLGIEPDRGSPFLGGTKRKGWEVWTRVPTLWENLRLEGSLQQWEEPGPYLPEQIYRGALVFHHTYLESGNFELWWKLGVRGNSQMMVHLLGEENEEGVQSLETVPFYQNWYGRIQVRIVTVQIFIVWENFIRRRNLQNFPGRVLPITRTSFGLRWTMWN